MAINYGELKQNGFISQKQDGKFAMRLRIAGGNITADQVKKVYEIAEQYGDGYVHLTSRQSVEIPFISYDDIETVKEELAKADLMPALCGGGVRTVTACHGNAICPSGNIDSYEIADTLDKKYFGKQLPHKFKMGVTGCPNNCLKAEENDLGIKGVVDIEWEAENCVYCGACEKVCRKKAIQVTKDSLTHNPEACNHCGKCFKICPKKAWKGTYGYEVSFGGLFGNTINKGTTILPILHSQEQLYKVVDTAVTFFEKHAQPKERFLFVIRRVGWDVFEKEIKEAYDKGQQ